MVGKFLTQSGDAAKENVGLKLCPAWGELHFTVAMDRLARKDTPGARSALQSGLQSETNTWWAALAQGRMAVAEGNTGAAISFFEQCLELDPRDPYAHYFLGTAYYQQGERQKARLHLRACLEKGSAPEMVEQVRQLIATIDSGRR